MQINMDTPFVELSDKDLDNVYEPAEDSFFLIDALEKDLDILKVIKPTLCLEIGCGSGVVITALAMALNKFNKGCYIAVDINSHSCRVTQRTGVKNDIDVNVIQMDLLSYIQNRAVFDIIIFNPPYVVTESTEIDSETINAKTWAGGDNGREIMEKVFSVIPHILSRNGIFYLLVIKENNPPYIIKMFQALGMLGSVFMERKIRGEHLFILKFTHQK